MCNTLARLDSKHRPHCDTRDRRQRAVYPLASLFGHAPRKYCDDVLLRSNQPTPKPRGARPPHHPACMPAATHAAPSPGIIPGFSSPTARLPFTSLDATRHLNLGTTTWPPPSRRIHAARTVHHRRTYRPPGPFYAPSRLRCCCSGWPARLASEQGACRHAPRLQSFFSLPVASSV